MKFFVAAWQDWKDIILLEDVDDDDEDDCEGESSMVWTLSHIPTCVSN